MKPADPKTVEVARALHAEGLDVTTVCKTMDIRRRCFLPAEPAPMS